MQTELRASTSWPSAWGAGDEHGMLNHVTPAKRIEALQLVREGRLYDLSHVLDEHVPVFPGRAFHQTLVSTAHHSNMGGVGSNRVNWITEVISGTTQLGTHLDALSHLQIGDRGYNGWRVDEIAAPAGVTRLGAETVPQIVTRGWLADIPAVRRVERLDRGEVITVADVECALGGAEPEPGDAVLFHTGWGGLWNDPDAYLAGEPGPGYQVADWLVA